MLDYNWEKRKATFSLVYNIFGKRITEVSTDGLPDVYESPRHQLDLVATYQTRKDSTIKLKMTNIFDEDSEHRIGDQVRRRKNRGQSFGLSLSMAL